MATKRQRDVLSKCAWCGVSLDGYELARIAQGGEYAKCPDCGGGLSIAPVLTNRKGRRPQPKEHGR